MKNLVTQRGSNEYFILILQQRRILPLTEKKRVRFLGLLTMTAKNHKGLGNSMMSYSGEERGWEVYRLRRAKGGRGLAHQCALLY